MMSLNWAGNTLVEDLKLRAWALLLSTLAQQTKLPSNERQQNGKEGQINEKTDDKVKTLSVNPALVTVCSSMSLPRFAVTPTSVMEMNGECS